MAEILIVADDYTGANDTAVMVSSRGYRSVTILDSEKWKTEGAAECIACSTESRGLCADEAYQRVYRAVSDYGESDTVLYSKRIDSTLRGNLGAETDGMLDALGEKRMAIVVPAFPRAGRKYVGGCMLVNDIPLYRTAAAADPKNPVDTASALGVMKKQSRYPFEEMTLEEMKNGVEDMAEKIRMYQRQGVRGIVFDAVTDEDLMMIAEAVFQSGVPCICVDPGAFTQAAAAYLYQQRRKKSKCLFVVGSVNAVAAKQTERLLARPDVDAVYADAWKILESGEACQREIDRMAAEAAGLRDRAAVCLCTTGVHAGSRVSLADLGRQVGCSAEELSARFNRAMARTAKRILAEDSGYGAVFACGGDVAVEVCRALGACGEYPLDEVIPLAVYGKLIGGDFDGYPIITKGVMVGDASTMVDCLRYLQKKMTERPEK